jgi:hypothetical protein
MFASFGYRGRNCLGEFGVRRIGSHDPMITNR